MLAKSILIAALAAIAVAAPTPEWGRHRHGDGKWGNWRGDGRKGNWRGGDNDNDNDWNNDNDNNEVSNNSWQDNNDSSSPSETTTSSGSESTPSSDAPSDNQVDSGSAVSGGFSGIASFYSVVNPGENHGYAAGTVSCSNQKYSNDDWIVALASQNFDGGSHCGKQVRITDESTGKTVSATLVDECATCEDNQLDLTPVVWKALHGDDESDGVFNIKWEFA